MPAFLRRTGSWCSERRGRTSYHVPGTRWSKRPAQRWDTWGRDGKNRDRGRDEYKDEVDDALFDDCVHLDLFQSDFTRLLQSLGVWSIDRRLRGTTLLQDFLHARQQRQTIGTIDIHVEEWCKSLTTPTIHCRRRFVISPLSKPRSVV